MISLLIDQHVHKNVCCGFFLFGKLNILLFIHEYPILSIRKVNKLIYTDSNCQFDSGRFRCRCRQLFRSNGKRDLPRLCYMFFKMQMHTAWNRYYQKLFGFHSTSARPLSGVCMWRHRGLFRFDKLQVVSITMIERTKYKRSKLNLNI